MKRSLEMKKGKWNGTNSCRNFFFLDCSQAVFITFVVVCAILSATLSNFILFQGKKKSSKKRGEHISIYVDDLIYFPHNADSHKGRTKSESWLCLGLIYPTGAKRCKVNGFESDVGKIELRVPHGSCLGPPLFLVVINNLPQAIECCSLNICADDTSLCDQSCDSTQQSEA